MTEALSVDPSAVAARLRPTIERGRAALLVGCEHGDRAAWIDRALAALEDPASIDGTARAPLVLRVRAREGAILVDELTARAEEALTRLRAPGALYDESSCAPVPALGGWLFRARSSGRDGLLIVLDELDGFLDLRGDRDRAESALDALGQLLEERARRPVSLLCTVRAGSASGLPAIPAALAALFDERISLGGARAVARDPGALVALLAGRTFTRAGLARAISAWCDVPDEDSVLVFSSPIAPTAVPPALDATGDDRTAVRSTADAPASPTPQDPLVGATEADPSPLADLALAGDARVVSRDLLRKIQPIVPSPLAVDPGRATAMEALRAALSLRSALDTLGDPAARRSTRQLERVFSRSIAPIPRSLESLRAGASSLGARVEHLDRRSHETLAAFEQAFSEAYASAFAAWVAGASRPAMLPDLEARLRSLSLERGARATAVLLCTGLRADAWADLRDALLARVSGLSVLAQGLHWAARPVTIAAQRALLARGPSALGAPSARVDEPPAARSLEEACAPRREVAGRAEVHRLAGYRHALAAEGTLSERLLRAERAMVPAIIAFVTAMPAGSLVLLAADVGARARASLASFTADPTDEPSVFEVLLPHAFISWGAERM